MTCSRNFTTQREVITPGGPGISPTPAEALFPQTELLLREVDPRRHSGMNLFFLLTDSCGLIPSFFEPFEPSLTANSTQVGKISFPIS